MNSIFRPLIRTQAFYAPTAARTSLTFQRPMSLIRPTGVTINSIIMHNRTVASTVSNKPGSQTLKHATTNVKEELGGTASDVAKMIAGANVTTDSVSDGAGIDSFFGITYKNLHEVPTPLLTVGLAGGLPYVGASLTTVYLAREASLAIHDIPVGIDPGVALTVLDQALNLQVTYGAVLLSFIGALHWGMEIAGYGGYKGYTRLALGTTPLLLALGTLEMQPTMALLTQWSGFTALWLADSKATMAGWTPKWYSQYRFYLSVLVGTWYVLLFPPSVRCIIGSLAGCSYWGPVAGHGLLSHDLDLLREERKKYMPEQHGLVPGNIEAVPAPIDSDHYTVIHKRKMEQENKKQD